MMEMAISNKVQLRDLFEEIKKLEGGNPQNDLSGYEELIILAESEENYEIQVDCLLKTIPLNMRQGFYLKSLRQGGTALQLINYHFPEDKTRLGYCYKELGATYSNGFSKNSIALDYFFKAIKCDVAEINANLYNNIGSLYKDAQLYDKALKYLEKGRAIVIKESVVMVFIIENLSGVYIELEKYEEAEKLLLEGIALSDRIAETDSSVYYIKGFLLGTLSTLLHKMNRTKESFEYTELALKTAIEKNHTSIIVEALLNKSVFALAMGDDSLFVESILKAIEYSKGETVSSLQISCLELLKKYHWDKGEFKEACLVGDKMMLIKKRIEKAQESNSMVDLLEEREAEIFLLENKNKMINRQKEELEQFAYIVAHDLKEPLRNIGGFGSLIHKRYNSILDEDGKEFLDFIVNSSSHMYSMLEDLLQYATVENTENKLELINPKEVIEDILYHAKDKVASSNTTIDFSDLVDVRIRKVHLNILFDNLIKNAIKFKSPDRGLIIQIKNEKKGNEIVFSVKDNGKGIDPKYHDSIFQIFKRLEKDKYKGTGIGLSVCKKIAENYQGKIWVESELDVGSTFFFSIKST